MQIHDHSPFCRYLRLIAAIFTIAHLGCGSSAAQNRTVTSPSSKNEWIPAADAKDIGQDWVRIKYDSNGEPLAMQTAIVRYAAAKSNGTATARRATVDLIGAVHIADVAYYRQLNDRFKQYDALLYELVAPEGTKVPLGRGTSNAHPIGALQNMAKDFLQLDHQLEYVDYSRPNFIHADMSPDEFAQAMKDRNESFFQMYFKLMGAAMAQQSKMTAKGESSDADLFTALFAADRPRRLKIILGKQLSEMESLMVSFGGEEGSVIISERNKKALGVLKQQLAHGKKHVGIFYGAGHLSDMDKHMHSDFHMQPESITWLTAWDLTPKP
jgi:hypothetical protein